MIQQVNKRFVIGIDRAKMKLFDVKMTEQNIVDSGQSEDTEDTFTSASLIKQTLVRGGKYDNNFNNIVASWT